MIPWSIAQLVVSGATSVLFLAGVVLVVWWIDRYDREPLGLVAVVFGWGAIGAAALSVAAERRLIAPAAALLVGEEVLPIAITLLAVTLEEILKGAGIVAVVVLSERFDSPTDGLVYGTAAGLGFAVTENLLYGSALAAAGAADTGAAVVLLRTVSASLIHGFASGAFGALLGVAVLTGSWPRRLGWSLLGPAAAIAAHAGWNLSLQRFPESPLLPFIVAVPLLSTAWLGLFLGMLAAERAILTRELADEVRLGVLPGWVAEVLPSYRRRVRSDWWPDRSERTVISRLLTRLAFRKHAIACLPAGESTLAGLEVVSLRQRARRTLGLEARPILD